jgi:hypothetical protein
VTRPLPDTKEPAPVTVSMKAYVRDVTGEYRAVTGKPPVTIKA